MTRSTFPIEGRTIGGDSPCFVVAEIAQAHQGDFNRAISFIDAAADARADAIKFQTHIAAAESTFDEPYRPGTSSTTSRYEYWQEMEFSEEQWTQLIHHARDQRLSFLSSPFSVQAVELLEHLGVPAFKVGSGEYRSRGLLQAVAETKRPVILSTGMSTYTEIAAATRVLEQGGAPFALLQATSRYPTVLTEVGINVIEDLRSRFGCPVGLSDHSGSIWPGVAAMSEGANIVEIHLTMSRADEGFDAQASLTPDELMLLVDARDAIHVMRSHPVDKDTVAEELEDMRRTFSKSIALTSNRAAGTTLTKDMLTEKKPGTGIDPSQVDEIVGRTLKRDVEATRLLDWADLE